MTSAISPVTYTIRKKCTCDGFPLAVGEYRGFRRQIWRAGPMGKSVLASEDYILNLSQPLLGQLGGDNWKDTVSADIDVTSCVRSGLILVS